MAYSANPPKFNSPPAPCWCCPVLALCCTGNIAAQEMSQVMPETSVSQDIRLASDFLNSYSLGFTMHYACGRNTLGAPLFNNIPASHLSMEMAADISPQLLRIITHMNDDPDFYATACRTDGPLKHVFKTAALSDALLNGLRHLSPNADGQAAFETGTYWRIRGYDIPFEHYVEGLHDQFSPPPLAALQQGNFR